MVMQLQFMTQRQVRLSQFLLVTKIMDQTLLDSGHQTHLILCVSTNQRVLIMEKHGQHQLIFHHLFITESMALVITGLECLPALEVHCNLKKEQMLVV